ncbi:outer membrane protein [Legionella israelensis]|uniref:Opacity protein-like surface antigen n=1 Tax=Legionella israelensis TaxID=454 RepID=A0A0W0WI84_9GAMM|nr:outer membrane beta-barrel protein [Legionella israelensis]KTD32039.1 opacity protein-like surface antigen [Legionella israelensis]QBS09082.1 hypothetical protein E4T55_03965 [Legionella israelensis]SCY08832.1 Opacity protein [Legionella israelensis DSM 19235]STX58801.1 opacity protein-like surface antigen [Legionella israelensis]
MKPLIRLGLALSLLSGQVFAYKPVEGWYAGFLGEVSYTPDVSFTVLTPPVLLHPALIPVVPGAPAFPIFPAGQLQSEIGYRIGGGGGGQLGYRLFDCYRLELEILFNTNSYDDLTIGPVKIPRLNSKKTTPGLAVDGRTNVITGMINGYYDFLRPNSDSNLIPYVGLGIGYVSIQDRISFYYNGTEIGPRLKETKSTAAGQIILGASYFLDDFTSANLDYRFITTNNISEQNRFFVRDERFQLHTINFSMNFAFDSCL